MEEAKKDGDGRRSASDSIRILRDLPTKVSRCLDTRDLTFVVPNAGAGRYAITYERLRALDASTTTVID